MNDTIYRQAAIDVLDKIFPADPMRNDYTQGITCGAALATEYIKQLPPAQSEIIRCKDCKYADEDGVCQHSMGLVIQDDDDYCSYAERRTNG